MSEVKCRPKSWGFRVVLPAFSPRALVEYSFVCGSLCGHGNPLMRKKIAARWRVRQTSSSWTS